MDVGPGPALPGSDAIEEAFERFYTGRSLPFKGTDFDGRSDYGPFIAWVEIPAGGLFTGAEGQDRRRGCDLGRHRRDRVRPVLPPGVRRFRQHQPPAFDVNIDAVAYTTLQFGMTTIDVNDVPGNPDFEEGLP